MPVESALQASATASGLVNSHQLDYAVRVCRHRLSQQGIPSGSELPDRLLADILIEQGILTEYQADQLLAGRTKFFLGQYLITDWIGQGGMGQVFKGLHQVMGRECAVKVLPASRATQEARDSFAREIRMQSNLDCPYLVRAFDAGQDGNVHYLVTEYVPGMDLRRLVKSRGPLPVQHAASIIMQAALGLDYAHRKGLVHRDVKPGNILVTPSGDAKVSDVGLAGFAKDLMNDPQAGKIVGTTDYLSPEQIRTPLKIQPASDIYSLGCTLYYAVCGKVPFPGGDTQSKLRRHLEEFPLHPRNFVPDITEDFVDIIVDMMEKDPDKRIAHAAEVAARLEPWAVEGTPVGAERMSRSPWLAPPPPSHYQTPLPDQETYEWEAGQSSQSYAGSTESGLAENTLPGNSFLGRPAEASAYSLEAAVAGGGPPCLNEPGTGDTSPAVASLPTASDASGSAFAPTSSAAYPVPPPPPYPVGNQLKGNQLSPGMLIALTVAIAVPPALLLGAILGYIVAAE